MKKVVRIKPIEEETPIEERCNEKTKFDVGDIFKYGDKLLMVAVVEPGRYCLIFITEKNGSRGNRWNNPVRLDTNDKYLKRLLDCHEISKCKKVKVKIEEIT